MAAERAGVHTGPFHMETVSRDNAAAVTLGLRNMRGGRNPKLIRGHRNIVCDCFGGLFSHHPGRRGGGLHIGGEPHFKREFG
jgi:hypothetical protein